MTSRRGLQAACSLVAIASCGAICASPAAPVRQIAGLSLVCALTCAVWLLLQRFDAIVPAIGLTLACLILTGVALAAVHVLRAVPAALALGVVTLAAAWAGTAHSAPRHADRRTLTRPPSPLALTGVLIFAAAAVLAVRYSAASATSDADRASSVALWAYPSGNQLHVGVTQPAGHGAASLRIVVTRAGVTVAAWSDIHLAPGQTWAAPALTVTGTGPASVVVLDGGSVVARLSSP